MRLRKKEFVSPVSRIHFYSLRKAKKVAKFNRITQVQPSVFRKQFHAKNFAVVESGLKAAANSPRVLDRHNFKPVHPPYQIMLDPSLCIIQPVLNYSYLVYHCCRVQVCVMLLNKKNSVDPSFQLPMDVKQYFY